MNLEAVVNGLVAFFAVGMVVRSVRPGWRPWVLTAVVVVVRLCTWGQPAAGILAMATISLVTLTVAFADRTGPDEPTDIIPAATDRPRG